jgi:hypothetical protein
MLLPRRAVPRLVKWPTALSINSRTGVTLASRGNSTSLKLRGLEVLSLQDSLRCSTHKGSTKTIGDVIANSTTYEQFPTDAPTRTRISFFGSRVMRFCERSVSVYQDSYVNFYVEVYERRLYRERTTYRVLGGVTQEYLKHLTKQTPFWLVVRNRSLRNPQEQVDCKKRDLSNQPQLTSVTPIALQCIWVLEPIKVWHSSGLTLRRVPYGKGLWRSPLRRFL